MAKERLYLFDTTLRDGAQTTGVDFSLEDKRLIARTLDELGVDYIEGGYPGANVTDTELFSADPGLAHATFTAFGMTKRPGRSVSSKSACGAWVCGQKRTATELNAYGLRYLKWWLWSGAPERN